MQPGKAQESGVKATRRRRTPSAFSKFSADYTWVKYLFSLQISTFRPGHRLRFPGSPQNVDPATWLAARPTGNVEGGRVGGAGREQGKCYVNHGRPWFGAGLAACKCKGA